MFKYQTLINVCCFISSIGGKTIKSFSMSKDWLGLLIVFTESKDTISRLLKKQCFFIFSPLKNLEWAPCFRRELTKRVLVTTNTEPRSQQKHNSWYDNQWLSYQPIHVFHCRKTEMPSNTNTSVSLGILSKS